jgi:hypothetical protein
MNTTNHESLDDEQFSQELDAALAKYRTIQPRVGIEDRVLANLRAKNEQATPAWTNRFAFGILAAVAIAFGLLLVWRTHESARDIAGQPPSAQTLKQEQARSHPTNNGENAGSRGLLLPPERKPTAHRVHHTASTISIPRQEIFPSPQPLSEQEQMLADYVSEHRKQAVLIARARVAALKKDREEEIEQALARGVISGPIVGQTE